MEEADEATVMKRRWKFFDVVGSKKYAPLVSPLLPLGTPHGPNEHESFERGC